MRILITGCTPQHAGKSHQLNYALTPGLVAEGLRAARHEVDQRSVVPGEKLRHDYDQAIVFYFNPEARNTQFIYGALWALSEFPDALAVLDDWNIGNTFTCTRRMVRDTALLTKLELRRQYRDEVSPYRDRCIKVLAELMEGRGHRIALPLFPWCDVSKIKALPNKDLVRWFDPSPLVTPLYRKLERRPDARREQSWVLGALTAKGAAWRVKQQLGWPVEMYGNRKLRQPRLNEIDLVRRYGEVEGVLSFRTSLAGSGWWRLRIVHAAAMGCVLAGDPAETAPIGTPYRYRPAEIEGIGFDDRRQLARDQAKLFQKRSFSKKELVERLDELVRENM